MELEKRKAFLIHCAYFGVILLLAVVALRYVLPLTTPFLLAFFIAYLLKKPIGFLRDSLGLPAKLSAVLAVILFYGTAGAAITLLSTKVISETVTLVGLLPKLYETHVLPFFTEILENLEGVFIGLEPALAASLDELGTQMLQSMGQLVSSLSVMAMGAVTGIVSGVPGLFIKLILMIISSFFITIDYERLTGFCLRQMSEGLKQLFFQVKEYIVGTLWICIRSYLLIMSITFVELSIALTLAGINHSILVAFVIAIFDILPVLGTGGIMIPWSILTAVQGNYSLALKLILIYLAITVIRNIIEPKIVGGQLGLHPVVTLCSMFVGAQLLGVVGLFGFPIGLSLLRHLNDHGVIHIFR